mmetsp:Transcript_16956/g.22805  ORF Transcript_16956/g.22805 Transcript_16956/m.22805 type:complete len:201 (-) Transcript_16956:104-706(-)
MPSKSAEIKVFRLAKAAATPINAVHLIRFFASGQAFRLNHPSSSSFTRNALNPLDTGETSIGASSPVGISLGRAFGRRGSIFLAVSEWNAYITSVASALLYRSIQWEPEGCAFRHPVRSYHSSSIRTTSLSRLRPFGVGSKSQDASLSQTTSHALGLSIQSTSPLKMLTGVSGFGELIAMQRADLPNVLERTGLDSLGAI